MSKGRAGKQLLTLEQLRALRTPLRHRILDAFERHGPLSVVELARWLRRVPETLYYHVSALEDVGLLRRCGTRMTSGPPETLFDLESKSIEFDRSDRSPAYIKAAGQLVSATLRQAERLHLRALENPKTVFLGPYSQKRVYQAQPRLTKKSLKELNRLLAELDRFIDGLADEAEGEDYSITIVLSPISEK